MPLELVKSRIRAIQDFPKPGILFRDITPLLLDARAFRTCIDLMLQRLGSLAPEIEVVAGPESRGFIFGMALAERLDKGFIPIRKPGKLPHETASASYQLEYGTDSLEMHRDALSDGERVLLVDDLLATGGTMGACARLVEQLGGQVAAMLFCIELKSLNGRQALSPHPLDSLICY